MAARRMLCRKKCTTPDQESLMDDVGPDSIRFEERVAEETLSNGDGFSL